MGHIIYKMSSPSVVQGESEAAPLLDHDYIAEQSEIVKEISDFLKFNKKEEHSKVVKKDMKEEENTETPKSGKKRKRKTEENIPANILTEVFLRIFYPISSCLGKSVSIGLMKSLDYSPTVILNHGTRMVLFSPNAWESFLKHLHLIECYLASSMCGRKTNIRLLDCDNEIDVIKHRGQLQVRIRDLTQHENKVLLSREEFFILNFATSPITRYMRQLVFSSSVIKEYLVDTLEKEPDSTILYGPVDTSIFNRIPHEVEMWRQLRSFETVNENIKETTEETTEGGEEEEEKDYDDDDQAMGTSKSQDIRQD
jgi:hypothetical protein